MRDLYGAFLEGGSPMYLILILAVAGHVIAVIALVRGSKDKRAARLFGGLALGLGLATAATGWLGEAWGNKRVDEAVAFVNPSDRNALLTQGRKEAAQNIRFGLPAAVIPALVGLMFVGRSLGEPDRDPALPPG